MIGKVIRGANVRRLLYYLYGPGKANEHTDPRLVAGFGDPAELEPRPSRRRAAGLPAADWPARTSRWPRSTGTTTPSRSGTARCGPRRKTGCSRIRSGRRVAAHVMHADRPGPGRRRAGGAVGGGPARRRITSTWWPRWPARTGTGRSLWNSYRKLRRACRDTEEWFGLRCTAPADRTAAKRPTRAESEQAIRRGWDEPPRTRLRREVCTAAAGARTEDGFFAQSGAGRGAGAPPLQHPQPRRGDRVRGRHARPHGQGWPGHLVRRREARGGPDAAEAAGPVG